MQIKLIQSLAELDGLAAEWNELALQNHVVSPFLQLEFQRAWWHLKGGGEWKKTDLFILAGYGDSGELVGIAPLFRSGEEGSQKLLFIGSHEIADFLDIICAQSNLQTFISAIIDFLLRDANTQWESLDLWNLLAESKSIDTLQNISAERGLEFSNELLESSPIIALPKSFDDYLESLSGRDGKEMRRKLRKAARYPLPIDLEILGQNDDYEQGVNDFFALMAMEKHKAEFLQGEMREQMQSIGQAAFAGGWGQLAFLRVGEQRLAAYFNFDYANRIWAYNSGFNPEHSELSPGLLLTAKMVEWCIENGRETFDFMRGDEDYKYRVGGLDRYVQRVRISR
jgi:CelD/BcsL family acetyltransferase involved in cellulose biosynthesis